MTGDRTAERLEAVLNAYAEHVVTVELERDDARADRDAYRKLALSALEALRTAITERDRLRDRLRALLNELRATRSHDTRAA